MRQPRQVGVVSAAVIKTLGKEASHYQAGDIIYIGERNLGHMKSQHISIFLKYHDKLALIISEPDYVGINEDDGSLEYVKIFDEHVKLAIRIAGDNKLYIRTMFTVLESRTDYFIKSGRLKPLTKEV